MKTFLAWLAVCIVISAAHGSRAYAVALGGRMWVGNATSPLCEVQIDNFGSFGLDWQRTNGQGDQEQAIARTLLTNGRLPRIDVMGDCYNIPLTADVTLIYEVSIAKKDPAAPDVPVPITIRGNLDASGTHASGSPWTTGIAWGTVSYKHPEASSYETLASVSTGESKSFNSLRAQPIGAIGWVQLRAQAYNDFQLLVDPAIGLDPNFQVEVGGVLRPAAELYEVQMSYGFAPVQGDYFAWDNPAGGSFDAVANWRTWDGHRAPPDGADIEFGYMPGASPYTVTGLGGRTVGNLLVERTNATLDLGGGEFTSTGIVRVGEWDDGTSVLTLCNGTLITDNPLSLDGNSYTNSAKLVLASGARVNCPSVHCVDGNVALVMDGGELTTGGVVSVHGSRKLTFNSGHLTLTGGSTRFSQYSGETIGNGVDEARMTLVDGELRYSYGVTLASQSILEVQGGTFWASRVAAAQGGVITVEGGDCFVNGELTLGAGSTVELTAGRLSAIAIDASAGGSLLFTGGVLHSSSDLAVGAAEVLGPDLTLGTDMRLEVGTLNVTSAARLALAGGVLLASTLAKEPGATLEYDAGDVTLTGSGDLAIGESGFVGPNGSTSVYVRGSNGLRVEQGGLWIETGYTLQCEGGTVYARDFAVDGTFALSGGSLSAQSLTKEAGACVEYGGGDVTLSGDLVIGGSGFSGPSGSLIVRLQESSDRLTVESGGDVATSGESAIGESGFTGPHGSPRASLRESSGRSAAGSNSWMYVEPGYTLQCAGGGVEAPWMGISEGGVLEILPGATVRVWERLCVDGELRGEGEILGSVENSGLIAPGLSPGEIIVQGDLIQWEEGRLLMEVLSDTEYDRLTISGHVLLGGTLEIAVDPRYSYDGSLALLTAAGGFEGAFDHVIVSDPRFTCVQSGDSFVLTVIPEPSASVLLVLGALLAGSWRCHRRRIRAH